MRNIVYLQNQVINRSWGDTDTLHTLYDIPNPNNDTQAELWLGAYSEHGSKVQKGRKLLALADIVSRNSLEVLGESNALKYNNNLPFLLKFLVVNKPLPVLVNPNTEEAFVGYARENLLKIDLNDPKRNYVDANGRPGFVYALSPLRLMCGFRALDVIKANLAVLTPRFFMEQDFAHAGVKTIFDTLMRLEDGQKRQVVTKALQNAPKLEDKDAAHWVGVLAEDYPDDVGALMPALLNLVNLNAGEALYIATGTLYSYLKGVGLVLTGNSNNALRCALTTGNVDLTELNIVTAFESLKPAYIEPQTLTALETLFAPPESDFALSVINMPINGQIYNQKMATPEILFCVEGKFTVSKHGHKTGLILKRGEAMFVSYAVGGYSLRGQGLIYKASIA